MKEYVSDTILIGKQAHIYLSNIMSLQRGCIPLDLDAYDKQWEKLNKCNGKRIVDNYTYGGGDGSYNGKWWSWSVDTIKSMLEENGIEYEEGEKISFIFV